jgi:hypothetical protein
MQRVLNRLLEYPGDGLYYLDAEPFSGIAFFLAEDGWEKSEIEYRRGLRWGTAKEWYLPGAPMREATYYRGVLHGRAVEWHSNGRLAEEGEYEHGFALWKKSWDEAGNLTEDYRLDETDPDYQRLLRDREIHADEGSGTGAPPAA